MTLRRSGSVGVLLAVAALASAACGSRVQARPTDATPPAAAASSSALAPSTTGGPTGSGVTASSAAPAAAPSTAAPTTASTAVPPTTPLTTAPPTTGGPDTAAFCAATRIYAPGDLPGLGARIVADPAGILAAYDAMDANAPADLAAEVHALGPLTRTAVGKVQSGEITSAPALQAWLVNAPREDLEGWVRAQQIVAPKLAPLCG